MNSFKVIAFTHKTLPLEQLGKLHLTSETQSIILPQIKKRFSFAEILFLSTCNRIELFICSSEEISKERIAEICLTLNPSLSVNEAQLLVDFAEVYSAHKAVAHVLRVASSLESLVIGEREIITQVRKAYDFCNGLKLTGDFIRLLLRQTIETAKEIYTHTAIAKNPVSVASLAYRQLRDLGIKNNARIVFVGSGQTNTVLASYFQKHKFANFTVFNRTLKSAQKLAATLNGRAFSLDSITYFKAGFDVLVVCTAATETIITSEVFASLNNNDTSKKVIIDLGVPANVDKNVATNTQVHYIDINSLKARAETNMLLRKNEVAKCELIINDKALRFGTLYEERCIERAFGEIPRQVKAIKELALNEVFARDIKTLNVQGREILEKVLSYMEKKYNAVAIKTAKEVFRSPGN